MADAPPQFSNSAPPLAQPVLSDNGAFTLAWYKYLQSRNSGSVTPAQLAAVEATANEAETNAQTAITDAESATALAQQAIDEAGGLTLPDLLAIAGLDGTEGGTVTSVSLSAPLGGGTVTTSGTLGTASFTAHGVLVGEGSGAIVATAAGAANTFLAGVAGADPAFRDVNLASADVAGTLPVANGGTGEATLSAHGVVIGNGTSGVNVTGAGTAGQALTSNGASADPTFQTPSSLPAAATIATSEATSSATYADLTTPGPAVTKTTGTSVLVQVYSVSQRPVGTGNTAFMSVAVSGASTVAASDANAAQAACVSAASGFTLAMAVVLTGLTAGSNTFTAKYRVDGGTFDFYNRTIVVTNLN